MDEIYEVQAIGNGIWVTKEVFDTIKLYMEEGMKLSKDEYFTRHIDFLDLSGAFHRLMLHGIMGLYYTTKEQRKTQTEIVQKYQMEQMPPFMLQRKGLPDA